MKEYQLGKVGSILFGIFIVGFLSMFLLAGVFAIVVGIAELRRNHANPGFIALGLGIFTLVFCYVFVLSGRRQRQKQEARAADTRPPWLRRADWAAARIEAEGNRGLGLGLLISCLILGIGVGIHWGRFHSPGMDAEGKKVAFWMGSGACLVGAALIVSVTYAFWHRLKFGRVVLHLRSLPGRLGESLEGTVEIPRGVPSGVDFKVRAICYQITRVSGNDGDSHRTRTFWSSPLCACSRASDLREAMRVSFSLPLPADQPPTGGNSPWYEWKLEIQAPVAGVGFCSRFELPVYPAELPAGAVS